MLVGESATDRQARPQTPIVSPLLTDYHGVVQRVFARLRERLNTSLSQGEST
jgi:hypothetical protein